MWQSIAPCKGTQDILVLWIPKHVFQDSKYWIPVSVSRTWIPDSLSCIPDSEAHDSGIPQAKFSGVRIPLAKFPGSLTWSSPAARAALGSLKNWSYAFCVNFKQADLLSNDPGKVDSNFFCYAKTVLSPHRNVLIFTQRMHKPTWRPFTQ